MSTRQDPRLNPKRWRRVLVIALTVLAYAVLTLVSGCAGINIRHMRVDGVRIPDPLYTQCRKVAGGDVQLGTFGPNMQGHELPRVVGEPPSYNRHRAYRQVRALALWSIEHGYDCEIWTLRRCGWAAHPVLAVTLPGGTVMLDPARHYMFTRLGKWTVVARMDEDDITHKGIPEIGRQLTPTKGNGNGK